MADVRLKRAEELALMRKAGLILFEALKAISQLIRPGVTTKELDEVAEATILEHGAIPSFKGYRGYPASICAAVNDQVVHGIPSKRRLREGEIVGIDLGACYEGYHADTAVTFPVGQVSPLIRRLMRVASEALYKGIEQAKVGSTVNDIARAIQQYVERHGFSVVRDLVGHGVGCTLHEQPEVPNFVSEKHNIPLQVGMTLAIEPMVVAGDYHVKALPDGWTIVTEDSSWSSHFEHTVAVTKNEPFILTLGPNGDDRFWRVLP